MSLFSTIRSADLPSPLYRDRSAELPRSPAVASVAEEPSLPRHLLVSLAGITAEISSLQPRCADAPQLRADLGGVLDRLDGLVDSIYACTADPASPGLPRSGRLGHPPD